MKIKSRIASPKLAFASHVKSVFRSLFLNIILICSFSVFAQPPSGTWSLVAEDNFNTNTLDTKMWGSGSTPWGTENQSSCTLIPAEDTWVSDTTLVLRSRSGGFTGPSGKRFDYTSGWAWQKIGKKYGYIEIRAKYPNHPGAWPAFWMLGDGWPPEFDIAEYKGPTVGGMTLAFYDGSWFASTKQGDYTTYHTYGLLWEPNALTWYMDGEVVYSYTGSSVPSADMYVILSNGTNCDIADGTGFPNYVNVDWFRWWQGTSNSQRCDKYSITPYLMINNIEWIQSSNVTVKAGTPLRFRPEPAGVTGGSYSWTGNGVTSTSKELAITPTVSGSYTVTYTSTCGSKTTATYNVTIDPNYVYPSTPILSYFQIDDGTWQESANITVVKGSKLFLAPHPYSGGTWTWSGGGTSGTSRTQTLYPTTSTTATATYTNQYGSVSTLTININVITPCASTAIVPFLQSNNSNAGAWQQTANVTVPSGSTVSFGPQPNSGGTWSWTGCGTSGTNRSQNITPTSTCTATATYTNDCNGKSTQDFVITVTPPACASTPIVPYLQVNTGTWQQASNVTVASGSAVSFGPQPYSGGTWSWTGCGTSGTNRTQNITPTSTCTATATYTNDCFTQSKQDFVITVNTVTGLDQNDSKNKIDLFPNPVNDILHFSKATNWELCSLVSETLAKGESEIIDMTSFKSGIYIVKTADGVTKIFKQ